MKNNMKKLLTILSFLLVFLTTVSGQEVYAGNLKFDKTSVSISEGDTFEIQVVVDAGSDEIVSTDAYINFDSNILEAVSVANGTFFPTVFNELSSPGQAYIAGIVDDPATSKTGTGTIATITFKALTSGSTTLVYDCQQGENETSKIIKNDFDATNVIVCSENGSASVTAGTGGTGGTDDSTDDSATDDDTTGTGGTDELPQSGIFDNILKYATPGILLVVLGIALKFIL